MAYLERIGHGGAKRATAPRDIDVPFGLWCALDELPAAVELVRDPTTDLSAEVTATVQVLGAIKG